MRYYFVAGNIYEDGEEIKRLRQGDIMLYDREKRIRNGRFSNLSEFKTWLSSISNFEFVGCNENTDSWLPYKLIEINEF
jgi:hypothetical protein